MKLLYSILLACLLFGCSEPRSENSTNKPMLFTSIIPQIGLVRAIAGEQVQVTALVGEGQSPHTYEPTARQLALLTEADALFTIGAPFESRLIHKIKSLYPDLKIIDGQQGITLRTMGHGHHCEHCTHDHGEKDPHIWLSVENLTSMAGHIYTFLADLDPDNAAAYRVNYDAVSARLTQLDLDIRAMLAPHEGARIYVFHPSFGYFTDAYGLEQVSIELDGKSPTPRQLADLIEQAKADGVKIIFVSKQFPMGSAKAVADAIQGEVVQLDPLEEDVIANLWKIAESVSHAMEP